MKKYRLLYAEDDEMLAFLIKDNLQMHNYDVDHFYNGDECLKAFDDNTYDVCILDVMMPGLDGFAVAGAIRKVNDDIPIIFLSAKTLKEDRLKGLRLGADDYLVKPFSIEELLLKIEMFLTRSKKNTSATRKKYNIGSFRFEPDNFLLTRGLEQTELTLREAELLKYFLENQNEVLKREQILTAIWGQDDYFFGRSLDVFISRLRKIFVADDTIKIENLHGIGFRFLLKNKEV